MARAIGIDFGTANIRVAVVEEEDGKVSVIKNRFGTNVNTPCVISFWEEEPLLGERAKELGADHPESIVCDILQLLGKGFTDPDIQDGLRYWPFGIVPAEGGGRILITVQGETEGMKTFHPEELASLVLAEMRKLAEDHLGFQVSKVVITIPNWFTLKQRHALLQGATMAGLDQVRLIPVTAAATIFNEFGGQVRQEEGDQVSRVKQVQAFCLGKSTWNRSAWQVFQGSSRMIYEVARNWVPYSGQTIAREVLEKVAGDGGQEDKRLEKSELYRLLEDLGNRIELVCQGESSSSSSMTSHDEERQDIVEILSKKYYGTLKPLLSWKNNKNYNYPSFDIPQEREVLLVGRMASNPHILKYNEQYYVEGWNKKIHKEDEFVACGAAIYASTNLDHIIGPQIGLALLNLNRYKVSGGGQIIYFQHEYFGLPRHFEPQELQIHCDRQADSDLELKIHEELYLTHKPCNLIGTIRIPHSEAMNKGTVSSISIGADVDVDETLTITVSSSSTGYQAFFRYPHDFYDTNLLIPEQLQGMMVHQKPSDEVEEASLTIATDETDDMMMILKAKKIVLEASCMRYLVKADEAERNGILSDEERNSIVNACMAVAKSVMNDELDSPAVTTMLQVLEKEFQPIFADD